MTIKKGEDWGAVGPLPADAPIASTDAELAALFVPHGVDGLDGPEVVGLASGGDLARTLGGRATPAQLRDGERTLLPIDLTIVSVDGSPIVMAANLVIRSSWWRGSLSGAFNASHLGAWNVAPSGHPNDGRVDVLEADLSLGDRWKARSRLPAGTHLPHPNISVRRLKRMQWDVDSARNVTIDGVSYGSPGTVALTVVPDAVTVAI